MEWTFDERPRGAEELAALLERSGAEYRRAGGRFRLQFASQGRRWQTVCECWENRILVYGVHPVPYRSRAEALELCSRLNRTVVQGGFFLQEGRIVSRTGACLEEPWRAQEDAARALEYNAAVLTRFWGELAAEGPK